MASGAKVIVVENAGVVRQEGMTLAPGKGLIWLNRLGVVVSATRTIASQLVSEDRQAAYKARKERDQADAKAAGQAAFDAFIAQWDADHPEQDANLITESERLAEQVRVTATRERYIELGYTTGCEGHPECKSLLSPIYDGDRKVGNYRRCAQHSR